MPEPESQINEIKKILVVEHQTELLARLKSVLEGAGYDVTAVTTPKAALEKSSEQPPDLIIAETSMPLTDGYDFIRRLKDTRYSAKIPILILTERADMEERFRIIGVEDFLAKPYDDYVLLYKVAWLLNQSKKFSRLHNQKKILLAGTDPEVLQIMNREAQKYYCRTKLAFSGAEVLTESVACEPDLIIMEIQMDGIESSEEVIKAVRLIPKFKKIPIVTYSFYRVEDLGSETIHQKSINIDRCQKQCLQAGASEYLGRFHEPVFSRYFQHYMQATD